MVFVCNLLFQSVCQGPVQPPWFPTAALTLWKQGAALSHTVRSSKIPLLPPPLPSDLAALGILSLSTVIPLTPLCAPSPHSLSSLPFVIWCLCSCLSIHLTTLEVPWSLLSIWCIQHSAQCKGRLTVKVYRMVREGRHRAKLM